MRRARVPCTLALLGAAAASIAAVPTPGQHSPLALSCLGCHEPRTDSPSMPALDRRPPASIAAALRRARDQPQPGSIMARFAARLTDEDIDELAVELGKATAP